jgi:hypothetical protein
LTLIGIRGHEFVAWRERSSHECPSVQGTGFILVHGIVGMAPQGFAQQRPRELAADGAAMAAEDKVITLRFRGYFQSDGRLFPSTETAGGVDNLLIRRARPILEATVGGYFEFRLMPDFGGTAPTIFDAYWDGTFIVSGIRHPLGQRSRGQGVGSWRELALHARRQARGQL